jgi:threonine dehydrogenase-like Zn-dependent dehydrogenase
MFGVSPATDVYIEATGAAQVITDFIVRARRDARMSIVAIHHDPVAADFLLLMAKQLTIRGSVEYPARFAAGLELLARRDLSEMITHRVALERFDDALTTLSGSRDCGKVMVMIDGEQ